MSSQTYALTGLHCGACVKRVTQALSPLADQVQVTLDPMQAVLTQPKADLNALQQAVAAAGNYHLELLFQSKNQGMPSKEWTSVATESVANQKSWLQTYQPLLLVFGLVLLASILVQVGMGQRVSTHETMRLFMAGFFLAFAFFKLLDIRGFANAYAGYDLLAARWPSWGLVYPFVELALGLAYLANFQPTLTNWATLGIMGFSSLGVIAAVLGKRQIRCACLGTGFNLPMSTVTIVEDLGMVGMAVWMLA
jgi:copper chaperone CopZ